MLREATLLAAMCVAAHSCSNPLEIQEATLLIEVDSKERRFRWAPDGNDREGNLVNSLDDPRGFAGLELEIGGTGPLRMFTASDFADGVREFRVPDSGYVTFSARLRQDADVVAEGSGRWALEPNVEWRLEVSRAPLPRGQVFGFTLDDLKKENPPCGWFWCIRNWRFPITDDAANYEYEALWLSIYRYRRGECPDGVVCG